MLADRAGIVLAESYSFGHLFRCGLPARPLINSQNHREVSNFILGSEADFEIRSTVFGCQK